MLISSIIKSIVTDKIHTGIIGAYLGYTFYYVNGRYLRDTIDVDFCEGGNPGRYAYIPLDEIWIDNVLEKEDIYATMVHEYLEMKRMINYNWSYNRAHDYAAGVESIIRNKKYKGTFIDIFKEIIIQYKEGKIQRPIGWVDTSNPHGRGYQIMTENGMKVYDISDYKEFEEEKRRVKDYLKRYD